MVLRRAFWCTRSGVRGGDVPFGARSLDSAADGAVPGQQGVTSSEDASGFLYPRIEHLHDPFLMRDMALAVDLVLKKVSEGDRIVV